MSHLSQQIAGLILHGERAEQGRGNVDAHNPHFVGRTAELRRLREGFIRPGTIGVLTAVHGQGGLGKTALALEYAHACAHEYGGGRWQIPCEGRDDLRVALVSLAGAPDLEFGFTDEEKKDLDRASERVLRELKKRADGAPSGRALLILDNVDRPKLLEPTQTARLPQADWLHLVATTRLGAAELFDQQEDRAFVTVDELPAVAALELIESYQPGRRFRDAARAGEAAAAIVRLLGRFTLAVETAAVFLGQFNGDVTCSDFRDRLNAEGLTGLDRTAITPSERLSYGEKSLGATLAPTLERLGKPGRLALGYAALLPADQVALPWLRAVMAEHDPKLGRDAEPGHPDPWKDLVRRLFNLRLLQPTGVRDSIGSPLVVRMHRLVQEFVRRQDAALVNVREAALLNHAKSRAQFLWNGWVAHEHRWELGPLAAYAWQWLERGSTDGAYLAHHAAGPLLELGKFAEAESLRRRSLAIFEQGLGPDHPNVASALNNLAMLLRVTNRLVEAEPLYRRALAIDEQRSGPDHPRVAACLNNLASLLGDMNRPSEAEPFFRRALAIDEQNSGPDDPKVAVRLNNLAQLLRAMNRLGEAEPLFRRALAIAECLVWPGPSPHRSLSQQPGAVAPGHRQSG